jgi:putative oxidoreductase
MQIVRTLLRVLIGGLFVGHGTQKLFGWFGGYGPEGTGQFFESVGLRPGKRNAILAGASEAGGGALLAAGLLTPVAGALLTGVMAQAVRSVKMDKGPFAADGGWELEALFAAAALTVVETGPGPISLDSALGIERSGTLWALLALGAGVAGPALLVRGGEAPEAQSPDTAVAAPAGTPEAADAGASS